MIRSQAATPKPKPQAQPKPQPQPKAKPAKTGARRNSGGGGLAGLAQQQAQVQVSAAEQPIEQQIAQERAANLQKAQAQQGFAKAAAAIMQQAAPAVGQAYTNAANADAGYAQGLGSVAQSALDQNQQQNNQFLQQMGTPAAALHPAAPVGQIEYGLQGYIPASTLQQEGAGWEAQAQLAPGNVLNQGTQAAQQTLLNDPTLVKLQDDLAKVAATQPDVYSKLLNQYQTQAYKNAQLGIDYSKLGIDQQKLRLSAQKQSFDEWAKKIGLQQGAARIAQGQARLNVEATRAANSNAQAWARIGIENRRLKMEAAKAQLKASSGGFTPDELVHIKGEAGGIAYNAFNGVPATSTKAALPPLSYKQALKQMVLHGVPLSIAIPQLHQAGYVPGVRGTPQPPMNPNLANALFPNGVPGVPTRGGQSIGTGGQMAPSRNAGGFLPSGAKFSYNRHDQGRDIQTSPGTPILAPGAGYVVRVASDPGGGGAHFGPAYPIVHFTSGPYAGQDVYIGHTVTAVKPGQRFKAGAILSHTQHSGPMNGGAPDGWAEIGFAPGGTPGVFDQPAPF